MSRISKAITAGALVAVCASTVIFAGSGAANAETVPVVKGTQTSATFVVPEPGSWQRSGAPVSGNVYFPSWPGVTADDVAIAIGCDNAVTYSVRKDLRLDQSSNGVHFSTDLPLSVVGHSCTLTTIASNGVPIWIQPANIDNDKGKTATYFSANLLYRSRTGGL